MQLKEKIVSISQKIAIVFIAFIVISFVMILSVEAIRVPFLNIFLNESEKHADVRANYLIDEIQSYGFQYIPSNFPQGFMPESIAVNPPYREIYYIDNDGRMIRFVEATENQTASTDNEDIEIKQIVLNGHTAYFSEKGDFLSLVWEQNGFFYSLMGDISKDELFQIAGSLKKLE